MQKYLLSEEQLVENGYPRPTSEMGVVSIKREKIVEPVPVDSLGSNGTSVNCVCVYINTCVCLEKKGVNIYFTYWTKHEIVCKFLTVN